jgi:hypothetical protein
MDQELKQEKTVNKAWKLQVKKYKQSIINLGVDPNNLELVKNDGNK